MLLCYIFKVSVTYLSLIHSLKWICPLHPSYVVVHNQYLLWWVALFRKYSNVSEVTKWPSLSSVLIIHLLLYWEWILLLLGNTSITVILYQKHSVLLLSKSVSLWIVYARIAFQLIQGKLQKHICFDLLFLIILFHFLYSVSSEH